MSSRYFVRILTRSLAGGKLAATSPAACVVSSLRNSSTTGSRYKGSTSLFSSARNSATTKAVPLTLLIFAMGSSVTRFGRIGNSAFLNRSELVPLKNFLKLAFPERMRWSTGDYLVLNRAESVNFHRDD